MRPGRQVMRVLVTVKAYPAATANGEAVCVAGVRVDTGTPEWIRLFPVPFRDMEWSRRFKKYDVIELEVMPSEDSRPESWKPNAETITVLESLSPERDWEARRRWVEPLLVRSMCEIRRAQTTNRTSLGVFRPGSIDDLTFEAVDLSTVAVDNRRDQLSLLDPDRDSIEVIPYKIRYRYRCASEPDCTGHNQSIIDWELSEAYREWRHKYGQDGVVDKIRQKWLSEIASPERETCLFVGNMAAKPNVFLVLGAFYPKAMRQEVLFYPSK